MQFKKLNIANGGRRSTCSQLKGHVTVTKPAFSHLAESVSYLPITSLLTQPQTMNSEISLTQLASVPEETQQQEPGLLHSLVHHTTC